MALAVHTAAVDSVAAVAVVVNGAASAAVLTDYIPPTVAIASILVSILAGIWYGTQLYDRFKNGPHQPH
jgi:hypothetical protein